MNKTFVYFPWQRGKLCRYAGFYAAVNAAIWTAVLVVGYRLAGAFLWPLALAGVVITVVVALIQVSFYLWVRGRMDRLHARFPGPAIVESEGRLATPQFEAPSLVRLEDDRLVLATTGGKVFEVPTAPTLICVEERAFNGRSLPAAMPSFLVFPRGQAPTSFIVPDPKSWREALQARKPGNLHTLLTDVGRGSMPAS